jgi:hypothetical protein
MKASVESLGEGSVFFGQMDYVAGRVCVEDVAGFLQALLDARLGKFFTRKRDSKVAVFTAQWHGVSKRAVARNPADIEAERLVNPCSINIEGFMAQRANHAAKLGFRALARHFTNNSDYPWHCVR